MTAAGEETILGPASEIEARAATWLEQRYFGAWNEASQSGLDTWLAQSLAHRLAYVRLGTAWESTQRLAALRRSDEKGIPTEKRRRSRPAMFRLALAAVAVAVIGAAATVWLLSQPHEQTYVTALGERETVTLADGSQIELNTDTRLRVFTYANRRTASLDKGEAYFEVKHNAARPFVVIVDDRRVTDLGTKFLVRRDADRFEVAVVEGRVRLDSSTDGVQKPTLLVSGESAIATAKAISVMSKPAQKQADELSWRQGVLVFDNTTLAEAAAEFNRYNSNKLVLADSASARLTIVGTFKTNDVASFAEVVQDILRLHVVRRGDETVITR
jgi:transmembrane sensor